MTNLIETPHRSRASTTPHLARGAMSAERWFALDAVVTGANAVAYVAVADVVDDRLGIGAVSLRVIGAGLLVFAVLVGTYAWRPSRWLGWSVVAANATWVVGSLTVALVGFGDLTGVGRVWIAIQALVVAALATMQLRALRNR